MMLSDEMFLSSVGASLIRYFQRRGSRARMGGWAKHAWILCPSLPAKKFAFAFLQKIFGLNLHPASKIFRHGAFSLRGAPRRAPKSRFFRPLPAPCSSIRIGSYLFHHEPLMSRAPRAW